MKGVLNKILSIISKILGYSSRDQFVENINAIKRANNEFDALLNRKNYFTLKDMLEWRLQYKNYQKYVRTWFGKVKKIPGLENTAFTFDKYCREYKSLRKIHNEKYIKSVLHEQKAFFDTIRNHPLTLEQRIAVITDEHNNYVNAGAGCGKTDTIISKIAYLTKKKRVDPHKILVLAFNDSVSSLVEEMLTDMNIHGTHVKTFHSFGNHVLRQTLEKSPEILFTHDKEKREFVQSLFNACMSQQPSYLQKAVYYFSYYLQENKDPGEFDDINSIEEYNRSGNLRTIDGIYVKSQQELKIANFLYIHSIKYEYERQYEYDTATKQYRQYRPDFYLTDYGIYLEHFAMNIDSEGKYISIFPGYLDQHKWKTNLHDQNNTKLISTFSYEFRDNSIFKSLESSLKNFGVKLIRKSDSEIINTFKNNNKTVISKFTVLMMTFLSLLKSSGKTIQKISKENNKSDRNTAFINLFRPIYEIYQKELVSNNAIDFDDMIAQSAKILEEHKYSTNYEYIIVDEFQDIGYGRYKLLNEIRKQNQNAKTFCVGDDWQAIYRFAGGDVSILYDFEDYFGIYTEKMNLTKTFRLPKEVTSISNDFIKKNKYQTQKIITPYSEKTGSVVAGLKQNLNDDSGIIAIAEAVNKIGLDEGKTFEIQILNRYGKFIRGDLNQKYKNVILRCSSLNNVKISYSTIHRFKGGESDYVILDDVDDGLTGFPNRMGEDSVLKMLLRSEEDFVDAEERRLFYVALTRCKTQVFILSSVGKSSMFFNEIIDHLNGRLPCQECGGFMVTRINTAKDTKFFGCNNFPICENTVEPNSANEKYLETESKKRLLDYANRVIS